MQSTLLLGASGQVGKAMAGMLPEVIAPTRHQLDLSTLTHDQAHQFVASTGAGAIVNCAAYTAVDKAEEEVDVANAVNGTAVGILAEIAAESGIPFVTYSTDFVFNGRGDQPYVESSAPDPINAYGRSKLIGERLALEANPETLIIRTSWVVSGTHSNFVATMVRLASEGRSLNVVNDQHGCPTIATDLAVATVAALGLRLSGLLHLTNQGATTWFELAKAAVGLAGLNPELITPCTTDEYPTPAPRPTYSVLGSERIDEVGVARLPRWEDSLPGLINQLKTS